MTHITLHQGDITMEHVDAIVNAANPSLAGGGGVDGAIHAAAGPELAAEAVRMAPCATGEAKATRGYHLPAKFVIHTVGPVYAAEERPEKLLAACYQHALDLARTLGVKSIAFPSIATGVYGYPVQKAALIAVQTVHEWVLHHPDAIAEIRFITHRDADKEIYAALLQQR